MSMRVLRGKICTSKNQYIPNYIGFPSTIVPRAYDFFILDFVFNREFRYWEYDNPRIIVLWREEV